MGTMKTRIVIAFASFCMTCIAFIAAPAAPVQAEILPWNPDTCGRWMPSKAFDSWTSWAADNSGALAFVAPTSPVVTGVGTSQSLAATSAGAGVTAAASVAAFLSGMEVGCRFLDWEHTDAIFDQPLSGFVQGTVDMTPRLTCNNFSWIGVLATTDTMCIQVSKAITYGSLIWRTNECVGHLGSSPIELSGVTFEVKTQRPQFTVPGRIACVASTSSTGVYIRRGNYICSYGPNTAGESGSGSCVSNDPNTAYSGTTVFRFNCNPSGSAPVTTRNYGSYCGVPPGTMAILTDNAGTVAHSVVPLMGIELQNTGWERQLITDVRCINPSSGAVSWVRAESGSFFDTTPDVRIPLPECPTSHIPVRTRTWRIPWTYVCGVSTGTAGGGCPSQWMIEEHIAPADWDTVGTRPDWTFCLGEGNNCGPAYLNGSGVCIWGAYTAPSTFCSDPNTAGQTGTMPNTAQPKTTAKLDTALIPTSGQKLSTATPLRPETGGSTGGGGGTGTVTVAIDDDGETQRRVWAGDAERGECWPNGWGWFNPLSWVLKPIKCALLWAFVPEAGYLEAWVAELQLELEESFPFSLLFMLHDFMQDMVDGVSASASCVDLGMGDLATGACMPVNAVPLGVNRSVISSIIVTLLVLSIAGTAVSLVTEK